ncbi:MAG: N-acetylmuramoyl-L-alanine amidase family protein, partial [Chloroflexota bacterium]
MTAVFKNGKLHTINIYSIKNILLILITLFFAPLSGFSQENQWVIVIDPGHGGKDPGAIGSFSKEKDINLAIALKTGSYIEQNIKNVKVVYTRKEDKTVDLRDRPVIANNNKADLFISIHTNQTNTRTVMGAETFIMGLTHDKENLAVAMKENEVMLLEDDYSAAKYQGYDPKSPESNILFTLMQNGYQKQSTTLASKIQTQFTEKVNRKDRGVKQAGFWVLFNTAMPSVLVETGFISNAAEEKFLNSEQGQDYLASAIFRACKEYVDEISSRSIAISDIKKDTNLIASVE